MSSVISEFSFWIQISENSFGATQFDKSTQMNKILYAHVLRIKVSKRY